MEKDKHLQYKIVRNCEPYILTPLWEVLFIVDDIFPGLVESEKLVKGKNVIIDLVHKGFIELYLGDTFTMIGEGRIKEDVLNELLGRKEYWYSNLAPDKTHVEIYLTPIGIDIAIGKLSFETMP